MFDFGDIILGLCLIFSMAILVFAAGSVIAIAWVATGPWWQQVIMWVLASPVAALPILATAFMILDD